MTPVQLNVRPMQWETLPELAEADPLDESDLACMREMRDVLARHGKLSRFAVHLVHRHFELGPDEILIERPDPERRTQHVSVGKLQDEPAARATTWMFDDGPMFRLTDAIYCVCVPTLLSGGCARHGKSSSPGERYQREEAIKQRRIAEERAERERPRDPERDR